MLTIPTNNRGMMDSVPLYSSILSIINIEIIEVNAMVIYNFQKSILVKINVLYALLLEWLNVMYIKGGTPEWGR